MNILLKILSLVFVITFVLSDRNTDKEEVQKRINAIQNFTDEQLFELIYETSKQILNSAQTRAQLANEMGLLCYYDLYQYYWSYVNSEALNVQDATSKEPENYRHGDILAFADVIVTLMWDEEYRQNNSNYPIESKVDRNDSLAILNIEFDSNLTKLETSLQFDAMASKLLNFGFLSNFTTELNSLFGEIYPIGKKCCENSSDKEKCLKVFVNELDRYVYVDSIHDL